MIHVTHTYLLPHLTHGHCQYGAPERVLEVIPNILNSLRDYLIFLVILTGSVSFCRGRRYRLIIGERNEVAI